MRTVAVIWAGDAGSGAAGGSAGRRGNVLLAPLLGRAVVAHAVAAFQDSPEVSDVVVVTAPALAGPLRAALGERAPRIVEADGPRPRAVLRAIEACGDGGGAGPRQQARGAAEVTGWPQALQQASQAGKTGQPQQQASGSTGEIGDPWESLRVGGAVEEIGVLIHDARHPLVSARVIADCVAALRDHEAVCAVAPVSDTMVAVTDGVITERPARDRLRRRQYPQGFRSEVIRRACELALAGSPPLAADECGLVLRHLPEVPVVLVPGSERDVPVTGPLGLEIAAAMLAAELS